LCEGFLVDDQVAEKEEASLSSLFTSLTQLFLQGLWIVQIQHAALFVRSHFFDFSFVRPYAAPPQFRVAREESSYRDAEKIIGSARRPS